MHRTRLIKRPRLRTVLRQRLVIIFSLAITLFVTGLIILLNLTNVHQTLAAVTGDYRSYTSGPWSTIGTWEKYNGTAWVSASASPTAADGIIAIRSGHTVSVSASVTADQLTIDSNASLVINASNTLTTADGSGTDLTINGTVTISGSGTLSQNASSSVSLNGNIIMASGGTHNINAGGTLTINNNGRYRNDGGSGTVPASGYLVVNLGGVYQHNMNGSGIPTATWNTGSTCEITGVTSTVPTNLTQSFCNFTWNCSAQSGNLSLAGSISALSGNFTINSTNSKILRLSSGGGYTLTINGDYIQTSGVISLTTANNGTATLNVAGDFTLTGGTLAIEGNSNTYGTVVFNGIGAQTLTASGYTLSGVLDFNIATGSTLLMGTSILQGRNFTLSAGGSILIGSSAGITSSGSTGNIQSTGTRSYSTAANYTYNGSVAQVTGNGLPSTVNNFCINNSSNLTLTNTVSASGVLTLTSGQIITGATEIKVTNTAASGVSGYSASSYVNGNLRRYVNGSGSYYFPIGNSTNYELLNVTLASVTGVSDILGTFTNTNPIEAAYPLSGIYLNSVSIGRMLNYGYWTLTPNSSLTGGSYAVSLNERGYTSSASFSSNYCVIKRSALGSPWQSVGTHDNTTQSESGGTATAVRSALTSFGHFGIGYTGGTLPIKLLYFQVKHNNDKVNITWTTASELNNDFFNVQRSSDGIRFEDISRKPGAGNSTSTLYYTDADDKPLTGYSYYRLKQTDYDGHFSYSEIKTVKYNSNETNETDLKITSIYPNPFKENFKIVFLLKVAANVEIQLFNSSGQLVYSYDIISHDGINEFDFNDEKGLPAGIYYLNLLYNDQKQTQKIIKQ